MGKTKGLYVLIINDEYNGKQVYVYQNKKEAWEKALSDYEDMYDNKLVPEDCDEYIEMEYFKIKQVEYEIVVSA